MKSIHFCSPLLMLLLCVCVFCLFSCCLGICLPPPRTGGVSLTHRGQREREFVYRRPVCTFVIACMLTVMHTMCNNINDIIMVFCMHVGMML